MLRLDVIILRLFLPFSLFLVAGIRYNGFSFIYLLFLLACPLLPTPTNVNSTIKIQVFLIFLITLSCIFTLSHPTLHIVLAVAPPYDNALTTCNEIMVAAQIGVQRLNRVLVYRALRLVVPDIFILGVAVMVLVYFSRRPQRSLGNLPSFTERHVGLIGTESATERNATDNNSNERLNIPKKHTQLDSKSVAQKGNTHRKLGIPFALDLDDRRRKLWRAWAIDTFCTIFTVVLICATGITSPSVISAVYLLSFLGICTYWACRTRVNPTPFASLRMFLAVYSCLHVCLYYLYQFPFFQSFCKDGDFLARLLGLYYIMQTSCEKPGEILFPQNIRIVDYLAPPLTMLLYYVLVLETRRWLDGRNHVPDFMRNTSNQMISPVHLDPDEGESHVGPNQSEETHTLPNITCQSTEDDIHVSSESTSTVKQVNRERSTADAEHTQVTRDVLANAGDPATSGADAKQINNTTSVEVQPRHRETDDATAALLEDELNNNLDEAATCIPEVDAEHTNLIDQSSRARFNLGRLIARRLQPHFDVLFGLTPPFLTTMYGTDNSNVRAERPLFLSLHYSAIRNSYILTLIAMMAWAVTYRSWLSFILLLSACILWITPNSRSACLYASPIIVLYGIVLILIQYVFGMNLTRQELPQEVTPDGLQLSELGMQRWENAIGALSLQITYLICFWLTLRLFVMEHSVIRLTSQLPVDRLYTEKRSDSPAHSLPSSTNLAQGHGPWAGAINNPPAPGTDRPEVRQSHMTVSEEFLRGLFSFPNNPSRLGRTAAAWIGVGLPFGTVDNTAYQKFTEVLRSLCVKYWIVVCCLSMLLISLQQPVVTFRIVYMVMLIYFLFVFQVSYRFWRRQMIFFWWVNVVYSMAILLCIYTYQFQNSPALWQNFTGLSEEILKDIGLETFHSAALFERLLTPVVFLVVIILQVHYFHEPFLKRSALDRFRSIQQRETESALSPLRPDRSPELSESTGTSLSNFMEDVNSAFQTVVAKLLGWATSLTNCCWRFLEIHWIKVVALVIVLNAVNEVSAPHIISLVLLVICFPFPYLHGFLATIMFFWIGVQILCKMCFQLNFVKENLTAITCNSSMNYKTKLNHSAWVGLVKVNDFYSYSLPMGVLLIVCVCWHAIAYRQRQFYSDPRHTRPREGIVFSTVTIESMGSDLLNVVKFAINYGFYKFGLELCHCITVVTACLRADAFSVLYLILMLIFLFSRREVCARLWLSYLVILAVLIPIQYAGCVGLPPDLCWVYPWITDSVDTDNLLQWLFLPGMYGSPTARKLLADFFQFAAVALQYHVFKIEQKPDAASYGGGSNRPVLVNNPPSESERDFVSYKESYLDYMRHAIFYWSYWVSLAIVLATGVTWITLFCLGYMILSFIYLWMGQNVMLRKRINLIKSWNVIIGYNFCVILAKCSLQLVGCVYWTRLANQCWFVQLFGVQCMNPLSWSNFTEPVMNDAQIVYDESCITVSSGLHWDVICFLFIVFQRKVFMTRSFGHVVLDLNVQSQFASRGAYLINRKLMLVINEQAAREQRSLEKIREKLEVIQRRQAALGRNTANINEHYIMLRSGDYYLFEGDPEEDDVRLNPSHKSRKSRSGDSGGGGSGSGGRKTDSATTTTTNTTTTVTRGKRSGIHFSEVQHMLPHSRSMNVPQEGALGPTVQPSSSAVDMPTLGSPTGADGRLQLPPGRLSTRFDFQQRHLIETLPHVEPSVVHVLANYTDPYSTSKPDEEVSRTETTNNNPLSVSSGRALGHRRMRSHPEYLRRHFVGSAISPPSNLPSEREWPEHALLPLTTVPYTLRTIRTSPSQLADQTHSGRTPVRQPVGAENISGGSHKPSDSHTPAVIKRKPYQTHRRLFSASAALTPSGSGLSTVTDGPLTRTVKRQPTEAHPTVDMFSPTDPSSIDPHPSTSTAIELKKFPGRKTSLPTGTAEGDKSWEDMPSKHVPAATLVTKDGQSTSITTDGPNVIKHLSSGKMSSHMSSFDRAAEDDADEEDDAGQDADWDSEEAEDDEDDDDDDANPVNSSASRLNPLQLLNRAMEMGACSTVRHYRRSLFAQAHFARSRQNMDSMDPTSCSNEDQHLVPSGFTRAKLQPKQKHGSFSGHPHALLGDARSHDPVGFRHMSLQHIVSPSSGRTLGEGPASLGPQTSVVSSAIPSVFNSESNVSQLNQSNVPVRSLRRKSNRRALLSSLASLEDDDGDNDDGSLDTDRTGTHAIRADMERSDQYGTRRARDVTSDHTVPTIASYLESLTDATGSTATGCRYTSWTPVDSNEINIELTPLPVATSAAVPAPLFKTVTGSRYIADEQRLSTVAPTRVVRVRQPREKDVVFITEKQRSRASSVRTYQSDGEESTSESSIFRQIGRSELSGENVDGSGGHQREEGCWNKFKASCLIGYMFVLSTVDSLIRFLNGLTRQYRRIRSTIDQEKRQVKRHLIANRAMTPEQSRQQLEAAMYEVVSNTTENLRPLMRNHIDGSSMAVDVTAIEQREKQSLLHGEKQLVLLEQTQQQPDHQREKAFRQSRSHAFLLLIALGNLAIVYSEWFCYFLLVLNHMRNSTILSLPYPLMVFLWGMLSVPRPTKTFWIFLITYTEIIIVIKYIFQFKFISFNDPIEKPSESAEALWLPRLFGLDKSDHYALFDLIQLISLFLHRGYLKNNGLWRDHTEFAQDLQLVVEENQAEQLRRTNRHTDRRKKSMALRRMSSDSSMQGALETENTNNTLVASPSNAELPPPPLPRMSTSHRMLSKSWNPFAKLRRFYWKMTDPRYNKKVDVYIYMFLCEFISFWIMIFGYVSFGPSTGMGDNAFEFIKSNRIPLPFISMLLVQFIFIIIDRGLFLQKQVLGKFIFQIIHVVLIHGWLSFILPHITRSPFNASFAPQLLYLIKCIYFSLSAYQIRSGYPLRILGNFLTKNYNYLNLILFKAYLIVPFLYELRNVMDWMWTHSALSLYHWMELEDIYAKIFVLKCWRRSEIAYPTPRGVNRPVGKKALVGGLLLAFFFLCFWGPMALSSFIGATFDFNPPVLCTFSVSFGGFPPIFEFASREGNIFEISQSVHSEFTRCHEKDKQTVGFLNNFEAKDVRYITIDGFSGNIWAITPPSHSTLCAKLADPASHLRLHFHMQCRRITKEIQTSQTSVEDIFSRHLLAEERSQLLKVLNGTSSPPVTLIDPPPSLLRTSIDAVVLNAVLPRYVLLKKDRLRTAYAKLGQIQTFVNVSFIIHHDRQRTQSWWELKELDGPTTSDPCFEVLRDSVLGSRRGMAKVLSVVTYNERVSDSLFGKVFSNYGIIGMYAAYIFLANRLLRTIYSNISYVIRLEELPHVDRILNLCNEIYLVRENNLLRLEEQLVAKLFFLYRSSETMIKWTRHPKHIIDKFTDKSPSPGDPPPPPPPQLSIPESDLIQETKPNVNVTTVEDPRLSVIGGPKTALDDRSGSNQYSDRVQIMSPPQSAYAMHPRIRRSIVEDDDGNQTRRRSPRVPRHPRSNNPDLSTRTHSRNPSS